MKRVVPLIFVLALATANAQTDSSGVGTVHFPNTGNRASQTPFIRGIAQLHSFAYREAAESFQEAERADPAFALPYWFEASTYRHALWSEENVGAARAVLNRLGPDAATRLGRVRDPKEHAYAAAFEALFAEIPEPMRALAFADSMRAMARRYPNDLEVTAFTSVAIMGAGRYVSAAENRTALAEAESLATKVFREAPLHPGGAHYVIHSVDYPSAAPRGLTAAREYARIAPAIEHAQHMPAHIFLQLGMWDDVVKSNEHAWKASRDMVAHDHQPATALDFHGLTWLQYGYLEQGRVKEARALLDTVRLVLRGTSLENNERPDARYALCEMSFRYAMETGDWASWRANTANDPGSNEKTLPPPSVTVRMRTFAQSCMYQRGVALLMNGDLAPAESASAFFRTMYERIPPADRETTRGAAPGLRAVQLSALLARARGDTAEARRLFTEAAALEAKIPNFGPPQTLVSQEILGEMYLAGGQAAEAEKAFAASLAAARGRTAAVRGVERARSMSSSKKANLRR